MDLPGDAETYLHRIGLYYKLINFYCVKLELFFFMNSKNKKEELVDTEVKE